MHRFPLPHQTVRGTRSRVTVDKPNGTTPKKPRRTQEERSATTKHALLEATLTCLDELGYAATSTTEIAERAGVSRGAQLHHYPTKAELVASAVEYIFQKRLDEFRASFAVLPADADRTTAAIELLWKMTSGPAFHAWLELLVAARTDPTLRASMTSISARFWAGVRGAFHEAFPHLAGVPAVDNAPWFTLAVMQGLALERIVLGDDARIDLGLAIIKGLGAKTLTPRS